MIEDARYGVQIEGGLFAVQPLVHTGVVGPGFGHHLIKAFSRTRRILQNRFDVVDDAHISSLAMSETG
ncbi:MAG: hypothetical protein V8Q84_10810 [Bilophila sp.]